VSESLELKLSTAIVILLREVGSILPSAASRCTLRLALPRMSRGVRDLS
jgi:hypothetical protein